MPQVRGIIGLPPLPVGLRLFSRLDDQQFAELQKEINGPQTFSVRRQRCEDLRQKLGLDSVSNAISLLQSLEFLFDRAHAGNEKGTTGDSQLREFLKSVDLWSDLGDNPDQQFTRLFQLLAENPAVDKERKRRWLRTGILDLATSFSSFVDLRPNFTKDRSRIEELVTTIIFCVEVQTESGSEKVHVFQLTERSFKEMQKAVEDISRKIEAVNADSKLKPLLVLEPEDADNE